MATDTRHGDAVRDGIVGESRQASLRRPRPMVLIALLCVAGHAYFTATAWLMPLVSEYTLLGDNISELAIGRFGYLQTAAFIAAGIGSLALAVGVRRATSGSWGSRTGAVLVGLSGVGSILAGIFPTDPIAGAADLQSLTAMGAIHVAAALIGFMGGVVGMLVLSRTFKRDTRWPGFWPVSLALALAALILLFLQDQSGQIGLYQRLLSGSIVLWLTLVALRLPATDRGGQRIPSASTAS
jgi:hypothetical protein